MSERKRLTGYGSMQESSSFFSWTIHILMITLYVSLNVTLNMINKWTLSGPSGFHFPIALSMAHQAFTLLAMAPITLARSHFSEHTAAVQKQWQGLLAISCFFAFNLGCNNISLLSVSLSLNQVIRACIPVATALGATVIENKPPTTHEFVSLLVMVSGVAIAIWEDTSARAGVFGLTLCVLGTLSNGFMMSSIGRLVSEKVDIWRLTWYTSPASCALLLPFFLYLEAADLVRHHQQHGFPIALIGLGCCTAMSYNVVHAYVIKVTSSVTATVLGEMKIVLILILSALWLGESEIWTAKMLLGVTVALLGIAIYSHSKLAAAKDPVVLPAIKGLPELPPAQEKTKDSRAGHSN